MEPPELLLVETRSGCGNELQMGCLVSFASGPDVSAPLPWLAGFTPMKSSCSR